MSKGCDIFEKEKKSQMQKCFHIYIYNNIFNYFHNVNYKNSKVGN